MNFLLLAETSSSITTFDVPGGKSYSMAQLFEMGGFLMWPILLMSVFAVGVVLMCLLSTREKAVLPPRLEDRAERAILRRDYRDLSDICDKDNSCFAVIMYTTAEYVIQHPMASVDDVKEVAAAEGARQAGILTRQISWLSDIGALAPMLGLLGTVVGMMRTFFEISSGNYEGVKQMQMAGGVAEALITTAGGLLLGIPAMLCYVYFRSKVEKRIADMEAAVTHYLTLITNQLKMRQAGMSVKTMPKEVEFPKIDEEDEEAYRDVRGM